MKKAVHFGAGNIGRGFIGQLLNASGYEITFVDVNQELVDDINTLGKYTIQIVGDEPKRILVENVAAVNGNDIETVIAKITEADIVTTAIGPNILKFIAPNIAKGIEKRVSVTNAPLNIIACENMVGGSTVLKNFVYEHLSDEAKSKAETCIAFPDAAVDRIVPIQHNEEKLLVQVEEYCEWDVDATKVVGERPAIEGLTYVDDLKAYIERKLFTINTGHAAIAYLAYQKGIKDIYSAMQDKGIVEMARKVWQETGELLVEKYGFDKATHAKYIASAEKRFSNPYISDDVTRVARGPVRKLSANDRLTSPAMQLLEKGIVADSLATVIAAALQFDCAEDKEAVEVQDYIKANGMAAAITHFTEIPAGNDLYKRIEDKLKIK
jgi:mannitol-1-phosphate 5-dehydrogenase